MNYILSEGLIVDYGQEAILKNLEVRIPRYQTTSIIGPNGCGKSTMLKALANVHNYQGKILVGDKDIKSIPRKDLSKIISMLPQKPESTKGISVEELVMYGRHPYASRFGGYKKEDIDKVYWAMEVTGTLNLKGKSLDKLSGGQRQRAWIALSLAQDTDVIFLDEPTTYLDIAHQLEVLELLDELKKKHKKTIVMVLHDINQASQYSDYIIALKDGRILKEGSSHSILTKDFIRDLFKIKAEIIIDKKTNKPMCLSYGLIKE